MGTLFLISFLIIAIVFTIMAVGVIFGKITLKGSCGGLNNSECLCSQSKQEQCETRRKRLESQATDEKTVDSPGKHADPLNPS
jgi:hypothetical protein